MNNPTSRSDETKAIRKGLAERGLPCDMIRHHKGWIEVYVPYRTPTDIRVRVENAVAEITGRYGGYDCNHILVDASLRRMVA